MASAIEILATLGMETLLDDRGEVLIKTDKGFRSLKSLGINEVPPQAMTMASKSAGEDVLKDRLKTIPSYTERKCVLSNKTNQVLGIGEEGNFLFNLRCVVNNSAESRVVVKDGTPIPKLSISTHATTACTTTVINTATNVSAVAADQYKDHLMLISGVYRRILSHTAFGASTVNSYTLDQALDVAPAVSVNFIIENPDFVYEALPVGVAVGTHTVPIGEQCTGPGFRVSTGKGVVVSPVGDF